jgi:hypothetical protein
MLYNDNNAIQCNKIQNIYYCITYHLYLCIDQSLAVAPIVQTLRTIHETVEMSGGEAPLEAVQVAGHPVR